MLCARWRIFFASGEGEAKMRLEAANGYQFQIAPNWQMELVKVAPK
jgi:hypothetical protein